ncbi:hypothetical protein BKP37_18085 [Anaerobacillus alkalilacustris]|uniref:DUF2268 domain-containing protein n=1 Tax=Anaerobacillus alkalilacustris TaxID=393763 RepID=A0A1S2LFH0_9BACI|nr:hypothetical protein BKP37_18085 [Anaerobacillus alkalilacustris]
MSVVQTNKTLKEFVRKRKETPTKLHFQLQRELLCDPVADHFEEYHSIQLHKYFLDNGMFFPDAKILEEINGFEKKKIWKLLQNHYERLKSDWRGEEATIYLFPVEKRNEIIMKDLNGKTGISFHDVIVLFLSKNLSVEEIEALLTHEYNHVCRLSSLNKDFDQLTLLDSMVIEGMAEVAVEKTVGKSALAPWVSLYNKKELYPYWQRVKKLLSVKGKQNHDPILLGDQTSRKFPKWFGYCIGYEIVKAYLEKNKEIRMCELLKKDSKEILSTSEFDHTFK